VLVRLGVCWLVCEALSTTPPEAMNGLVLSTPRQAPATVTRWAFALVAIVGGLSVLVPSAIRHR
jgi:hypothetical protein